MGGRRGRQNGEGGGEGTFRVLRETFSQWSIDFNYESKLGEERYEVEIFSRLHVHFHLYCTLQIEYNAKYTLHFSEVCRYISDMK